MVQRASDETPILAVMDIHDESGQLSPGLLDALANLLRLELAKTRAYRVVERGRQEELTRKAIKEQKKESHKACYDQSCQIPLGKTLAADTILACSVTTLGPTYLLGCRLIDLTSETSFGAGLAECTMDAASLVAVAGKLVEQLVDKGRD